MWNSWYVNIIIIIQQTIDGIMIIIVGERIDWDGGYMGVMSIGG